MAYATRTDARADITAANADFVAAFDRGDAAGIAALYTDQAQLLPPNSGVIAGRDKIQAFWQGAMDMGLKAAKLETVETEAHEDIVNEVGNYKLMVAGGQEADSGKYVVIWKNVAGQWKLHRDIWNSSRPPA